MILEKELINKNTKEIKVITKSKLNYIIQVSSKYNYVSQFLKTLPVGYINKGICNNGFTSLILQNNQNSILLVPTLALQRNKVKQYNHSQNSRVNHKIISVNGSSSFQLILNKTYQFKGRGYPLKFICTYDSFSKLFSLIEQFNLRIYIDQFDKMLSLLKLKSQNKTNDLSVIDLIYQKCKMYKDRVTYFTASPVPIQYLPKFISQVPYFQFKWNNLLNKKLYKVKTSNPTKYLNNYIINHIKKQGFFILDDQYETKVQKIIIYVNSINTIKRIIKKNNLNKDQVRILCGTQSIPKIDPYLYLQDPRDLKTFTFCTQSAFFGIDLYDQRALSIVVSDTAKDYMMINTKIDLKQAMSRIRTENNPFYGTVLFIYNTTIFKRSEEELIEQLILNKQKLQQQLYHANKIKDLDTKLRLLRRLNDNKQFRTYTYIKSGVVYINTKVYLADIYFLLQIRRLFNDGVESKVNKENNTFIQLDQIDKEKAPVYKDYVLFYLQSKGERLWQNKFINYSYKNKIQFIYSKTKQIPLSISTLNKRCKQLRYKNRSLNK